jgi:hypothetical protein
MHVETDTETDDFFDFNRFQITHDGALQMFAVYVSQLKGGNENAL